MVRIGIDLGGTKIEIIALDDAGNELMRRRRPTPSEDYAATLKAVRGIVDDVERELGMTASVGIATPGALSKATGRLKNSNSVCLNGQHLMTDLRNLLDREIRMANDADCFALSEATDGAASEAAVVFGVILGTGVGAGIAVNGVLISGPNAITGEWGHNPLPWLQASDKPSRSCYCGKTGCIETYLSGSALAALHLNRGGCCLTAEAIVKAAELGDETCITSLGQYEHRLARGLAHVINILDPDAIVLGGGLSNCRRLYQNVPQIWNRFVFSDRVDTRLLPPQHGDSSGVRGAAWLWPRG